MERSLQYLSRGLIYGSATYLSVRLIAEYFVYTAKQSPSPLFSYDQITPSGSLVYMKNTCLKSLKYTQMKRCLVHKAYKKYIRFTNQTERYRTAETDLVGLIINTEGENRVLFDYYGQNYDITVNELLNLPFLNNITIRLIETDEPSLEQNSQAFLSEIRDFYNTMEQTFPKQTRPFRDSVDIVMNFWVRTGLADMETLKHSYKQTERDIDCESPKVLSVAKYSKNILIKSVN